MGLWQVLVKNYLLKVIEFNKFDNMCLEKITIRSITVILHNNSKKFVSSYKEIQLTISEAEKLCEHFGNEKLRSNLDLFGNSGNLKLAKAKYFQILNVSSLHEAIEKVCSNSK